MRRRNFIQAVAAGSALSVASRSADAAKKQGPIKIGQIGTKHAHAGGQIATMHKYPQLYEFVGIVESDESQRQRIQGQGGYRDAKWMTEEQLLGTPGLEAVAVETEVHDLLSTAQRCVDAGLHIHLDKPAGESFGDLKKLHEDAVSKQLVIQMGYMFRYNPAFQFLFRAVREGWLGDVFEVHGVISKTIGAESRKRLARYPGGSLFELGCHLIDPLLHFMGPPERVTGHVRQTRPDQDNLNDNMLAVFEYPRATATIRSALVEVQGGQRRQFVVCGDKGTIVIRPLEPPQLQLTLAQPQGGFQQGTQTVELAAAPGRYDGAFEDMYQVIRGQKDHDFPHQHDLAVQRALLQACNLW